MFNNPFFDSESIKILWTNLISNIIEIGLAGRIIRSCYKANKEFTTTNIFWGSEEPESSEFRGRGGGVHAVRHAQVQQVDLLDDVV